MANERINYAIWPGVVPVHQKVTVTIQPRGAHARFDNPILNMDWNDVWNHLHPDFYEGKDTDSTYEVYFIPLEESHSPLGWKSYPHVQGTVTESGELTFSHTFTREQEYIMAVEKNNSGKQDYRFSIYALEDDLYHLKAYRGDMHVHSYYSDGKEAPDIVGANYRKGGFDFMALTDHHKYFPSDLLIKSYENLPIEMKIFHGEEVHVPNAYIHIINFNGQYSINELYEEHKEECELQIHELAESLDVPEGVDALDAAYRIWIAREIQKSGGMAILVHPHWISNAYNMPDAVTDYLFEHEIYDAFELLGGQSVHENNMQIAFYQEQIGKGRRIPATGSSDSHGTEPAVYFQQSSTIVLAENDSYEKISEAIKALRSVAVDEFKSDDFRVYGPYRYVKYVRYLITAYFRQHDELCWEQGRLMKEYACGDESAVKLLEHLDGRVEAYRNRFFGTNSKDFKI